jgi:hypothetical protein
VASTTYQSRLTLSGLALNVFISEYPVYRRKGGAKFCGIKARHDKASFISCASRASRAALDTRLL